MPKINASTVAEHREHTYQALVTASVIRTAATLHEALLKVATDGRRSA